MTMRTLMKRAFAVAWIAVVATFGLTPRSFATTQWPTGTAGESAVGIVGYCLNSSGFAVPWWNASGTWQCAGATVPVSATVTASVNGFQTTSYGTPISATTGGATGSIPTNVGEFVAQNVGTFGAFCKTGASVNTAGQYISPNGGWFAYAVTSETQITCEGVGGTTTVNLFGGTGLPTGTGGGGSGSLTGSTFDAAFPATGLAAGLNDGTNLKSWQTASALGDGVNGNNTAAVGLWLWNGTTWDRWYGDKTNGAWVNVKTSVLPTGASTAANQSTIITALGSPFQAGGSIGNTSFAATQSGAWNVTNISGTVSLPTGAASAANQAEPFTVSATNPTSTLTLTSATTAYTANQLIANNATAGSVVVPSFAIANSAGAANIARLRLTTNDSTSTAWGTQRIQVDLWSAAPTFTNGDRAAFAVATGSAGHLASFTCVFTAGEAGDGAWSECYPNVGNSVTIKLASGTSVYWTLDAITGSGVTGASKVFTLTAEVVN